MVSGSLGVLQVTGIILQLTLGVRLIAEVSSWKRIAGALFVLNALASTEILLPQAPWVFPIMLTLEIGTVLLLFLLPVAYARPERLRFAAATIFSVLALLFMAWVGAWLTLEWFVLVTARVGLMLAYSSFLALIVLPFSRDPHQFGVSGPWVVAGMVPRMAEFGLRFSAPFRDLGKPEFWVSVSALVLLGLTLACVVGLVLRMVRSRTISRERTLVLGMLAMGLVLGAATFASPAGRTVDAEVIRELSLTLVRPSLVAIGALGFEVAFVILIPLFAAGTTAAAAGGLLGTTTLAGDQNIVGALVIAGGLGAAAIVGTSRLGRSIGRKFAAQWEGPEPQLANLPRPQALLLLLPTTLELDERFARAGLARRLGVDPRNIHRLIEDAERAAQAATPGEAGQAIEWELRRGDGPRFKYFYYLTPRGQRAAECAKAAAPRRF